VQECPK